MVEIATTTLMATPHDPFTEFMSMSIGLILLGIGLVGINFVDYKWPNHKK